MKTRIERVGVEYLLITEVAQYTEAQLQAKKAGIDPVDDAECVWAEKVFRLGLMNPVCWDQWREDPSHASVEWDNGDACVLECSLPEFDAVMRNHLATCITAAYRGN